MNRYLYILLFFLVPFNCSSDCTKSSYYNEKFLGKRYPKELELCFETEKGRLTDPEKIVVSVVNYGLQKVSSNLELGYKRGVNLSYYLDSETIGFDSKLTVKIKEKGAMLNYHIFNW